MCFGDPHTTKTQLLRNVLSLSCMRPLHEHLEVGDMVEELNYKERDKRDVLIVNNGVCLGGRS